MLVLSGNNFYDACRDMVYVNILLCLKTKGIINYVITLIMKKLMFPLVNLSTNLFFFHISHILFYLQFKQLEYLEHIFPYLCMCSYGLVVTAKCNDSSRSFFNGVAEFSTFTIIDVHRFTSVLKEFSSNCLVAQFSECGCTINLLG